MQQLLLGLFSSSILLMTGNSLMCEHCATPVSETCSGSMKECPYENATCMTMTTETTILVKIVTVMKSCSRKDVCQKLQEQKGNILPNPLSNTTDIIPSFQVGAAIKDVTCNRGPSSFASFFPAFLGLLLMKLLF